MATQRRRQKRKRARGGRTRARLADRYDLYERAVQEPDADIDLIRRVFRRHFGRPPHLLREDFCGTAVFACEWVKRHAENRAWGIDLDPVPLAWGREHHVAKLGPQRAARLKLIEGNVLDVGHERVDVTVAFNFSYFLFRTREALRVYFEKARAKGFGHGKGKGSLEDLALEGWVALAAAPAGGYVSRSEDSPVEREQVTLRVRDVRAGLLDLEVLETARFDKDGQAVADDGPAPGDLWLLGICGLGVVALLVVILRRRAAEETPAVPAA